jgi:hypothetical protein
MRRVHTAPMEVLSPLQNGTYELEPHEAGWAAEATAMIYVREAIGPAPLLSVRSQISADGQRWIDSGHAFPPITSVGGYFLNLTHFGNWLRMVGQVSGGPSDGGPAFIVDFYWVFKD